jgi:hypothetical protein
VCTYVHRLNNASVALSEERQEQKSDVYFSQSGACDDDISLCLRGCGGGGCFQKQVSLLMRELEKRHPLLH